MNRILFDLIATQPAPDAKFHGGGEYAKLIFNESLFHNRKFDCIYNPNLKLDSKIKELCNKYKVKTHEVKDLRDIENIIKSNNYKFFYSAIPYYYGGLDLKSCHFIMTIHGLRDLECSSDETEIKYRVGLISILKLKVRNLLFKNRKENRSRKGIRKLISLKRKTIITDSEHSKYSILNFFPELSSNEVKVIYAPYKILVPQKKSFPKYEKIKKKYFLLVGGNRWIKNNYRAIKALDDLFSQNKLKDKKVVVIGVKNLPKLQNVKNPDNFIFIDYLNEDEFLWFFKNAFCFVYPSLNEGFGYPPLHAMSFNVPTVASAITSITEVCSNAVLYFNPFSVNEIKNRILQVNYNEELYLELQKKGTNRLNEILEMQNHIKNEIISTIFDN